MAKYLESKSGSLEESILQIAEKAESVKQQKLMALALQYKRGELDASDVSDQVVEIAKSMSEKDLEDFAKTKHKGLPDKKEAVSPAQQAAIAISKKEKGEKPKNEKSKVEGTADFIGAASKAAAAGKDTFEFGGKTYPVTIKKDVAKKVSSKMEAKQVKCPRCGTMNDPSSDKCSNCGLELSKFDSYQKEENELDEAMRTLAKKGNYQVATKGDGVAKVMYKGKEVGSGDLDDGAGGWFMSVPGERGQKFFDSPQKIADYFAQKKITEETLDEKFSDKELDKAQEIMNPTKSMDHGIKAIMQKLKVDNKTATKMAKGVMSRIRGSIKKEDLDEAVDAKKVTAYLVKKGSNPKDAEKMVDKHFKYATDKYRDSSVSKIADVIMSLGEESENIEEAVNLAPLAENVGAPRTAAHRRAQMTRNPSKSGGSGYDLYHKDFSSAMKHAYDHAKKKFGIEIDPQEIDDKVASGPRKPSKGKTNSYRLKSKDGKKAVQIQVYGMDDGKYELNMYKESVELDESKMSRKFMKALSWHKDTTGSPKDMQDAIRKMSDKELLSLRGTDKEKARAPSGSAQSAQLKMIDHEIRRRGIKEEVDLDEAKNYEYKDGKVHISKANFKKVSRDYKNSTKGKERMVVLDPKTQMTVSAPVVFTEESLEEKTNFTDKDVKMAIGIASDKRYKGGNMTGAVKAIEKIKKGLSDHPQVAAVLRRQNEQFKVTSMRDAMMEVWKNASGQTEEKDEDEEKPKKDGKTMTGKPMSQVVMNPKSEDK